MWKLLILSLLFVVAAAGPTKPPGTSVVDDGYTLYARVKYLWLHKVVQKAMTWDEAQKYCQAEGASLTGFESYQEAEFVYNMTVPLNSDAFYIGGLKKTTCGPVSPSWSDPCSRPNIFNWVNNVGTVPIDPHTWTTNNGGSINPGPGTNGQQCLTLRGPNPTWMDMSSGGYLDDNECYHKFYFICGKAAEMGR